MQRSEKAAFDRHAVTKRSLARWCSTFPGNWSRWGETTPVVRSPVQNNTNGRASDAVHSANANMYRSPSSSTAGT